VLKIILARITTFRSSWIITIRAISLIKVQSLKVNCKNKFKF
jgi:hypothetical protein